MTGSDEMDAVREVLGNLDWSPLLISLKTGLVATVLCFFLGIFAARKVLKLGGKARAVIDGILTLPMVLPPTVAGFFLLLFFSLRRPFGAFLYEQAGIKVVQTWLGCILAASVIAFPLMYRNARAAFEQVDVNLIYAGPGIASGTILTFARALGEYGATSMLAGNIAGKTGTISQKIATAISQNGDYLTAGIWVVIVMLIAFVIVVLMNLVTGGRNRRRW